MKILFLLLSCSAGLGCIGLVALLGFFSRHSQVEQLARRPRWLGMVFGTAALVWSAYHGVQMLEGDLERFRLIAWALVPVTAVLSWFYLDYINARVLGGIMTLCANHLINAAFVFDVPGRGFYSVLCLILGICGLIGIGLPWRFRDMLTLSRNNNAIRLSSAVFLSVTAAALIIMPWTARL